MKRVILSTCIALFATLFAYGQTQQTPYIEITGKSEREISPDKIFLKITINEKDYKGKNLSDLESGMIKTLKEVGVDTKKDLSIRDIASNLKTYLLLKNDIKLMKEYQLLVGDAKTAGRVIIELQKIGISQVSIDKMECSKIEQYKNEIKVEAIKNAKQRGEMLTSAIGQSLGNAIYINEIENNYREFDYSGSRSINVMNMMEKSSVDSYEIPDIEFDKMKIEASIIVRFELK